MTRFVSFLVFCFAGCEGIRSRGADVRRHQNNQEQEAVFATGASRGQITGHYETPRGETQNLASVSGAGEADDCEARVSLNGIFSQQERKKNSK